MSPKSADLVSFYGMHLVGAQDIREHLPVLKRYADACTHVTEFGVRGGASTSAFLMSLAQTVVSYDIFALDVIADITELCAATGRDWRFHQESSLTCTIDETDLLFIDTIHSYEQLSAELRLHHRKVRGHIIMHDTQTFGDVSQYEEYIPGDVICSYREPGMKQAIAEFLQRTPGWEIEQVYTNNNGLTILRRMP